MKPTVAESNIDLVLGVERIGILGHSAMGCMSLELAWRYPETTACVICIGAPPRMAGHIEEMARYWDDSGFDCAPLAQGTVDFSAPRVLWEGLPASFHNATYVEFDRSAHYPMYEEHDRFDRELFAGMERNQIG